MPELPYCLVSKWLSGRGRRRRKKRHTNISSFWHQHVHIVCFVSNCCSPHYGIYLQWRAYTAQKMNTNTEMLMWWFCMLSFGNFIRLSRRTSHTITNDSLNVFTFQISMWTVKLVKMVNGLIIEHSRCITTTRCFLQKFLLSYTTIKLISRNFSHCFGKWKWIGWGDSYSAWNA